MPSPGGKLQAFLLETGTLANMKHRNTKPGIGGAGLCALKQRDYRSQEPPSVRDGESWGVGMDG